MATAVLTITRAQAIEMLRMRYAGIHLVVTGKAPQTATDADLVRYLIAERSRDRG